VKLPENLRRMAVRFNQRTLRERSLLTGATLIALLMGWTVLCMDPLTARERMLRDEMSSLQQSIADGATQMEELTGVASSQGAQSRIAALESQLAAVDGELVSKAAGLIPPQRMVQVLHDVLRHQQGLKLISFHNRPMTPLVEPAPAANEATDQGSEEPPTETTEAGPVSPSGPFVHPVELVIEGGYLDVLRYVRALEALPWRFYWKVLDLETDRYPVNRVRIELTTLSMDKEWVGV